jgi:uncharacterized membrane protein YhaH (DUF805 family)
MTESERPQGTATDAFERTIQKLASPFTYRGRIGSGQYWFGFAIIIVLLFLALGAFASVMNSTGRGYPGLAIPPLLGVLWVLSAITIKRLRDIGLPLWTAAIFIIGPFAWLALTVEYIEMAWMGILLVFLAFFLVPGLMPSKVDRPNPAGPEPLQESEPRSGIMPATPTSE